MIALGARLVALDRVSRKLALKDDDDLLGIGRRVVGRPAHLRWPPRDPYISTNSGNHKQPQSSGFHQRDRMLAEANVPLMLSISAAVASVVIGSVGRFQMRASHLPLA
ncbi:MAG: hypothetical protein JO266_03965 [Acidobacteria bacterium]|nr:hypothetical protein [Acidobacteriota bacterium]